MFIPLRTLASDSMEQVTYKFKSIATHILDILHYCILLIFGAFLQPNQYFGQQLIMLPQHIDFLLELVQILFGLDQDYALQTESLSQATFSVGGVTAFGCVQVLDFTPLDVRLGPTSIMFVGYLVIDDRIERYIGSCSLRSSGRPLISSDLLNDSIICLFDLFHPIFAIIIRIRCGYSPFQVKLPAIVFIITQPLLICIGQYHFLLLLSKLTKSTIKFLRELLLSWLLILFMHRLRKRCPLGRRQLGNFLFVFEELQSLLEFCDIETLIGIKITNLESLRYYLLLLEYFVDWSSRINCPTLLLFYHIKLQNHFRSLTIYCSCTNFTMCCEGRYPLKFIPAYNMHQQEIMLPGLRTALHPICALVPIMAPNLVILVLSTLSPIFMEISELSSLRLEVIAPAAKCALVPKIESPTQLKCAISHFQNIMEPFISQLFPIKLPSPIRTLPLIQAPFLISQLRPIKAGPLIIAPCSITLPYPTTTFSSIQMEPSIFALFLSLVGTEEMIFQRQAGNLCSAYQGQVVSSKSQGWGKFYKSSKFQV